MREYIHKHLLTKPGHMINYKQLAQKAMQNDNIGLLNLIGGVTNRSSIHSLIGITNNYSVSVSTESFVFNTSANPLEVNGYDDHDFYLNNKYKNGTKEIDLLLYSDLVNDTQPCKTGDYEWVNSVGTREIWPKQLVQELIELSKNYILLGWYGDIQGVHNRIINLSQTDSVFQPYEAMYTLRAVPVKIPRYNKLYVDLKRAITSDSAKLEQFIVITTDSVVAYSPMNLSIDKLINLFSFLIINKTERFKFMYFGKPQLYTNTLNKIIFDSSVNYKEQAAKIMESPL